MGQIKPAWAQDLALVLLFLGSCKMILSDIKFYREE